MEDHANVDPSDDVAIVGDKDGVFGRELGDAFAHDCGRNGIAEFGAKGRKGFGIIGASVSDEHMEILKAIGATWEEVSEVSGVNRASIGTGLDFRKLSLRSS